MQRVEFVGVEDGVAGAEAHLRQPRALAQQHRKRLRADLGIERAVIAGADHVEPPRAVGDHAGEHVEPPGRAFRIGGGDDFRRQREAFQQRHDVDAIGLQHRAVGEIDLVQLQFVDALGHGRARPRQEARAHPIGDVAEPQIEARRLDLAFDERIGRQDQARIRHRRDHAVGQNAIGAGRKRERHGAVLGWPGRSNAIQTLKIRTFTGYPMAALTERARAEYQHDLSRGDLSRPACSHVK